LTATIIFFGVEAARVAEPSATKPTAGSARRRCGMVDVERLIMYLRENSWRHVDANREFVIAALQAAVARCVYEKDKKVSSLLRDLCFESEAEFAALLEKSK
jgi:hypothetical protein